MANSNPIDPGVFSRGSLLTASDIDRAVQQMKSYLSLIELKRRLLAPDVGALDALSLSRDILVLQGAA